LPGKLYCSQFGGRPVWTFENPVKICFGNGALDTVSDIIGGRPYSLVTYNEPYFKTLANRLIDSAGEPVSLIDNITPNPNFNTLTESCRQFADSASDDMVIIALGGGSVIDAAKVLAASNNGFGPVREYLETTQGKDKLGAYPIIAIPTTAGTGSEVTKWATVWDTESQKKYSLSLQTLYPTHAIVDPELMLELPKALTTSTGLDALSHALESI